jgi:two-component system, LytTR family, sensor kinase
MGILQYHYSIPSKAFNFIAMYINPVYYFLIALGCIILLLAGFIWGKAFARKRRYSSSGSISELEQYKQQLEMEQIVNFFSGSLANKHTQEEIIWDVARNLIHKLGFANCMIYLWNNDKTILLQKAGYGPNGSLEEVMKEPFTVKPWQGIVGHVAATKKPILLADTRKDNRYRPDVLNRLSELCVPALYNGELISVIDSEDYALDYYKPQHLQVLTTIATLMAARLVSIETAEDARRRKEELEKINLQVTQLELEQYKQRLEMEKITSFFSGSLLAKNNIKDVLNDVAKNLIGRLGFEDCMIYLWNEEKTKLIQHAGYGIKGEVENLSDTDKYNIPAGKGIIGAAVSSGRPLMVNDISTDDRYITADGIIRGSELCVPLINDGKVIGAINIEQSEKKYFTSHHLHIVSAIAAMLINKLNALHSAESLYNKELELSHKNRQLAESELSMLRSQMNPHFIFNSLNSVQKYIWENKEEDAAEYLAKFAKLMRAILENSRKDLVTLKEEMEVMKIYTELEHRRSNGRFDYTIKIAEDINAAHTGIPPMLLQPFIENAIWHGLSKKEDKGHLLISIFIASNQLVCIVEDDGVGRQNQPDKRADLSTETLVGVEKKSLGIEITKQRIERIMQAAGNTAALKIEDKANNGKPAGTKIIINLPYQHI